MKERLKKEIMETSRHQFIYGYDGEKRTNFLQTLEEEYPVKAGKESPIAIYMKDYFLPNESSTSENVDKFRLLQISRERFNLSMIKNIITKIIKSKNLNLSESHLEEFLNQLRIITSDKSPICSLESFLCEINATLDFYQTYYSNLLKGETKLPNIEEVKIPFIMPSIIVPEIKEMLQNGSYFGIIIDKQQAFSLATTISINDYVTRRINGDISIKIACEPDKWQVYYDLNGILAQATHDYGVIEFDESASQYTKKLIQQHKM